MRRFLASLSLSLSLGLALSISAWGEVAGSITVYSNRSDLYDNGSFARWVREFEAIHPRADVKVVAIQNYEKAIVSRFEARNYGDVVMVPRDLPRATYPNFFVPLDDMGLSTELYFSDVWSHEGSEYAYSQGTSAEGLVYNKKVFREARVAKAPQTLNEFFLACEEIQKQGKTAFALNTGAAWPLQQWDKAVMLFANDGQYYDKMVEDSAPFREGKPYEKSLAIAKEIFDRGFSETDFVVNQWEQSKVEFANGNIGMFYLGSWVIPQLIGAGMKSEDIGFAPFPVDNSGEPKGILGYDWGIAVSKYSKNPETAKAWVRFLLMQSDFADVSGFIPTAKSRSSSTRQVSEYMSYDPEMIEALPQSTAFIRLANKTGMDFMSGGYIRDILISPDFRGSMGYWNRRWRQAKENF